MLVNLCKKCGTQLGADGLGLGAIPWWSDADGNTKCGDGYHEVTAYRSDRPKATLTQYGLTQDGYDEKLREQNFQCPLCFTVLSDKPYIDHDHETGATRGLLCPSCNMRLSGVDDPLWLERATTYVAFYKGA